MKNKVSKSIILLEIKTAADAYILDAFSGNGERNIMKQLVFEITEHARMEECRGVYLAPQGNSRRESTARKLVHGLDPYGQEREKKYTVSIYSADEKVLKGEQNEYGDLFKLDTFTLGATMKSAFVEWDDLSLVQNIDFVSEYGCLKRIK